MRDTFHNVYRIAMKMFCFILKRVHETGKLKKIWLDGERNGRNKGNAKNVHQDSQGCNHFNISENV